MIIGVFLRHIKCYENLNFIQFVNNLSEMLNVFIGGNGVGKSTILESIGYILNEVDPKQWDVTISQKKDEAFICPVFLIKKEKFGNSILSKKLEYVSSRFWDLEYTSQTATAAKDFVDLKNNLKASIDHSNYYFISIGKKFDSKVIMTSSFDEKIFSSLKRLGVSRNDIDELYDEIISRYSYVYIPVESKIRDVLSLQASEMQSLMDKSVFDEIVKILNRKEHGDNADNDKVSIIYQW